MGLLSFDVVEAVSRNLSAAGRHRFVLRICTALDIEREGRARAAALLLTAAGVLDWPGQRRRRLQLAVQLVRQRTPLEELAQALLYWCRCSRRGGWVLRALRDPKSVPIAAAASGRPAVDIGQTVQHRARAVTGLLCRLHEKLARRFG